MLAFLGWRRRSRIRQNPFGLRKKISHQFELLLEARALVGLISWPKFSFTSYRMVSGLARQRVMPATVIDVGANVGQFAVAAAKFFPDARVYSIEPHPEIFLRLQRNIRKLPNVTAFEAALGEREGRARLHLNAYSHSSSLLPLGAGHRAAFPKAVEVSAVTVRQTTLDCLFAAVELKPPVLLKLDVQGYEAQTLCGATRTLKRVDYTVLEASFKPMYEGEALFLDLVRMMESYGFRFSRPVDFLPDPATREILQIDALFERLPSSLELRATPDG
jgi:FkbM family methyltransferase